MFYNAFSAAAIGLIVAAVLGYLIAFFMRNSHFAKLEGQLSDANDKVLESEAGLKKSHSIVKDKENQINSLVSKSGKLNDEIGALKTQVSDTESINRSLKNDLAVKQNELKNMEDIEFKFNELLPKFEHNTKLAKDYEEEVARLQAGAASAKAQDNEWHGKYNALVKETEAFKLDNEDMVNKFTSVKSDLDAANAEIEKLKRRTEKAEAATATEVDKVKAQIAQIESAKAVAISESTNLKSEVSGFTSKIGGLEGEIAALKAKLQAAEEEKATALANASTVSEEDLAAAKADADSFKVKWEELQSGNGKLIQEVEILKAKLNAAAENAGNNAELEAQISKLNSDLTASSAACGEKCAALEAEIEKLKADLEAAQAAEMDEEESDDLLFAEVYEEEEMPSAEEVTAAVGRVKEKAEKIDKARIGDKDQMISDDLKRIKGIGEFTETKLHAAGINSFRQIANFNDSDEDTVGDTIEFFPGRVRRYDWVGQAKEILGIELTKEEAALSRMKRKAGAIDFDLIGYASSSDKDDLKEIKGIGPFIEKKLNALGIFKFSQVGKFTENIDDIVNKAIEFFPGRIKRDDWKGQARELDKAKNA